MTKKNTKTRIKIPITKNKQNVKSGKARSTRIQIQIPKQPVLHDVRQGFMNGRETEYLHNPDLGNEIPTLPDVDKQAKESVRKHSEKFGQQDAIMHSSYSLKNTKKYLTTYFTNGLGKGGGDDDKITQSVVRMDLEQMVKQKPSYSLFILVCRWAKKLSKHYSDDCNNACHVLAEEVGYSVEHLISIRSWTIKVFRTSDGRIDIKKDPIVEYRKVLECMREVEGEVSANLRYNRLIGVIKNVHDILRNRQVYVKNWIQGHVDHEDRLTKHLKESSFFNRWINSCQHYHIAWVLVSIMFLPALHPTKQNANYTEGLIRSIFGNCKRRKDMVYCFFQLIQLFRNERAWLVKANILKDLLSEPSTIKNKVDKIVCREDTKEFVNSINLEFRNFAFRKKKTGPRPKNQNPWEDFIIVQKKICDMYSKFTRNSKITTSKTTIASRLQQKRDLLLLQQNKQSSHKNDCIDKEKHRNEMLKLPKVINLVFGLDNTNSIDNSKVSEEEKLSNFIANITNSDNEEVLDDDEEEPEDDEVADEFDQLEFDYEEDNEAVCDILNNNECNKKPSYDMYKAISNLNQASSASVAGSRNATIITNDSMSLGSRSESKESYKESTISFDVNDVRWRNYRMATHEDLEPYSPRLQVKTEKVFYDIVESVVGAYCAFRLRNYSHAYVHGKSYNTTTIGSNHMPTITIPSKYSEFMFPGAAVATIRKGNPNFKRILMKLQADLPVILTSTIEFGVCNEKRDKTNSPESLPANINSRLEWGNCGQSWVLGPDGVRRPSKMVNTEVFDSIEPAKREILMYSLSSCFDTLQELMDFMHLELGMPLPFNQTQRLNDYGMFNRAFLNAELIRYEWDTVQVKNITRGGFTTWHTDSFNCFHCGYDVTGCFYIYIVDGFGELWSIKFLANSRGQIGSLYSNIYERLQPIINRIGYRVQKIDESYEYLYNTYTGPNPIRPEDRPTHKSYKKLFIDQHFGWEMMDIGQSNTVLQKCMVVISAIDRCCLWPAGAVTIIRRFKARVPDIMFLMELLILAALQSSFHRYYYVGEQILDEMDDNNLPDSIGIEYCGRAFETFGMLDGGPNPRFVCSSLNSLPYFKRDRTEIDKQNLEKIKERLAKLLRDDINNIPDDAPYEVIRAVVQSAAAEIREIGECQFGEFRLLVLIQLAILSGILVKPRPFLNNLMYPVKDRASYQHLVDEGIHPEEFDLAMEAICQQMQWPKSRNVAETCLCESLEGRREYIYDILFYGMNLYCLNEQGEIIVKEWATRFWKKLN